MEMKITTISELKDEVGQILNEMGYSVDFEPSYGGKTFDLVAERKKANSGLDQLNQELNQGNKSVKKMEEVRR